MTDEQWRNAWTKWREKRQLWAVRVFLFETDTPFIWITEEKTDVIWKHLPDIGSDFGGVTVRACDYAPL